MNVGLIGLGRLSHNYYKGLTDNKNFNLVAVCDKDEEAVGRKIYKDVPFYNSFFDMVHNVHLDYALVATPEFTHYGIVKFLLENNINVIVEKPLEMEKQKREELLALAERNNLVLRVLYHYQYAEEVLQFDKLFDKKKINKIKVLINNAYSSDGLNLDPQFYSLHGCYIDAGINVLSMLEKWLPLEEVELVDRKFISAENVKEPIYAKLDLIVDKVPVEIEIDWRIHSNEKITHMEYEGKPLEINHTKQEIKYDGKVHNFDEMERLTRHYYNFFKLFDGKSNLNEVRKVYQVINKFDSNN